MAWSMDAPEARGRLGLLHHENRAALLRAARRSQSRLARFLLVSIVLVVGLSLLSFWRGEAPETFGVLAILFVPVVFTELARVDRRIDALLELWERDRPPGGVG